MKVHNNLKELVSPKSWFDTRHSLRKTLFWSFVLVIFLPMFLVGSVVAYTSITASTESSEDKLVSIAILKEAAINRWLDGVVGRLTEASTIDIAARTLYEFERRPAFEEHLVSRFRLDMLAIRGNSDDFEKLTLLDLTGTVKASTDVEEVGEDYSNRNFFILGQKSLYITPLSVDKGTNFPTLYVAIPVTAAKKNVVGVLVGKVKLSTLSEILQEANELGPESETYLATQARSVLAPDLTPRPKTSFSAGIEQGFMEQEKLKFYHNYADVPVVGAQRFIGRLGAVLLVEQSQRAAFASITRTVKLLFVLSLIIVAGAMFLGFMLSNHIVNPIRSLTEVATEIAAGHLTQTITLKRQDEVGILAVAFNNMTRQLRELINTLETRVKQRTQALAHRGAQLRTAIAVSQAANTLLDPQTLVQQAVDLVKDQFEFYYVGLFLVDERNQWAVLKAGTGEAGQKQLADKHRLKIDDASMVGWCINHRQPRISADVEYEKVRFVNPYLPETRSEMALPLISRNLILGAISIQSTLPEAFSKEDIDVLQTVADQIANALHNSQLFRQIQIIQARFQELYHRAPTGYFTLALDGKIKEINDTELAMLGYKGQREQIVNQRNITEFMTAGSKEKFEELLVQLRIGELDRVENLELTILRQETRIPVLVTATIEPEKTDRPREIYATAQDISQQKTIEAAREALLRETSILHTLGQHLLVADSFEEIYQAGLDAIKTTAPTWGSAVLLSDQARPTPKIELTAVWNNPNLQATPLPIGTTFSVVELGLQNILSVGQTLISQNAPVDTIFSEPMRQLLANLQIVSLVGVPLWSGSTVIGFVLVAHQTDTPFAAEEIRLFEGITRQMSMSINNHIHLQQAIQRATQLQAAAEVAKNTTAETSLETLLPHVANLIQERFDYYATSIFLVDDYRQYAVLEAVAGQPEPDPGSDTYKYKIPLNSKSQVCTAIAQASIQNVPDVTQSSVFLDHALLPEARSEITLPLIVRGQVIGALDVQSKKRDDFQYGEEMVLQTIADQLANAIHVARLLEKERAATREIQDLHQRYLEKSWDVYLQAQEDPAKTTFVLTPPDGKDEDVSPAWLPAVPDAPMSASYALKPNAGNGAGDDASAHSLLVSPLTLRDTPIGAVGLVDSAGRTWSEDDRAIIEAVSAQAALAIDNARLIEQTERWAALLKTSTEISQTVTATLDMDALLSQSVSLIQAQFKFKAVNLYLTDPATSNWEATVYRSRKLTTSRAITPTRLTLRFDNLPWQAIHQRQPVLAQASNPESLAFLPPDASDVKSALVIPLLVGQQVIGALELHSRQSNAFDQNQQAVLEILAAQVATSIRNATAYQEQHNIAEKLREVDKLKTQFLANMSHELRTPLNSIIGFSRVILKGIDGPLTELQKTDLASIHQSGKHLLDLINNILDLAKIEAGKMEINFAPINFNDMINVIISTAVGLVKDKEVEIISDVAEHLPTIQGDETRLRQVLLNLVSNAAKFTDTGTITIIAGYDAHQVWISVKDTGIGIAQENLDRIFDEFTQIDASTTRKAGGTGLGLPITRKFIELHHGRIDVESELGAGSTFTVTLPLLTDADDHPREHPSPPAAEAKQQARGAILVIDGDTRIAAYYEQYLQGKAIDVVSLTKGEQAVVTAKNLQPAAILLDILLPDIDGWQVLRELKESPHAAHIPVIICSIVEDRFRATQLGATDYLVKPIIKNDLLEALEKIERDKNNLKRVLVIDDHADDILLIRRVLESRACQVVEATNGVEGLESIYNNHPALVILDLTMPELDGFGVLQTLKSDPKTADIPVIVITARELNPTEKDTITQQAAALLSKGRFSGTELLQLVDRLLNGVIIA